MPFFKDENYGQGVLLMLFSVANRLREVNIGSVTEIPMSTGDRFAVVILIGISGLAGVGVTAGTIQDFNDQKYTMGQGVECSECGGTEWVASEGRGFMTAKEPTDEVDGLEKRVCTCSDCGHKSFTICYIPKYDGRTYYDDGSYSYYRNSYSSSGGSGGSSDGGGGGADW